MAILFLDSSAVVKRYVPEIGSAWVQGITDPASGNLLYLGRITGAEVVAAITRRQRRGEITAADAASVLAAFRRDFPSAFSVIEVTAPIVAQAMNLAETHGLRGYDAVQLAVAIAVRDQCRLLGLADPQVITADGDLNAAALTEGMSVDDPNQHP